MTAIATHDEFERLRRTLRVMPRGERRPDKDEVTRAITLMCAAPPSDAPTAQWMAWASALPDDDSDILWSVAAHIAMEFIAFEVDPFLCEMWKWGQPRVAVALLRAYAATRAP